MPVKDLALFYLSVEEHAYIKGNLCTSLSEKINTPIQHLPLRDLNWLLGVILSRMLLGYTDMLMLYYHTINLHVLANF